MGHNFRTFKFKFRKRQSTRALNKKISNQKGSKALKKSKVNTINLMLMWGKSKCRRAEAQASRLRQPSDKYSLHQPIMNQTHTADAEGKPSTNPAFKHSPPHTTMHACAGPFIEASGHCPSTSISLPSIVSPSPSSPSQAQEHMGQSVHEETV